MHTEVVGSVGVSVILDDILFDPLIRLFTSIHRIELLDDSTLKELLVTDVLFRDRHLNRGMVIAPSLELVELLDHCCAHEDEADIALDHVVDVKQSGNSELFIQDTIDLVTGVNLIDDDKGIPQVIQICVPKLSVVKHLLFETFGNLVLHLGLPGSVAHSGQEANIVRVNHEFVIRVCGREGGDLDHQTIHTDLGLLCDRDYAAVIIVELAQHPVRIILLVAKDVLGGRTCDTLTKRPGVLRFGRIVGIHDEIPVDGNDINRSREHDVINLL